MKMRSLLLVLAFTCFLFVSTAAFAQTSQASPSDDQYRGGTSGAGMDDLGDMAAHDAMIASGAIWANSQEAQATEDSDASAAASTGTSGEQESASVENQGSESSSQEEGESSGTTAEQDESSGTTAEQDESASASNLDKLPDTGGPSPLWLVLPLACAGSLIVRRIQLA